MIARRTAWLMVLLALAQGPGPVFPQLSNSPHDLGAHTSDWDSEQCEICHVLGTGSVQTAAWLSELPSPSSYTVYGSGAARSSTLDAWIGQPDGSSLMCLGCHDGTTALDIGHGPRSLGTDLSDDHPISFVYDGALAWRDGSLADPPSTQITLLDPGGGSRTGTIDQLLLEGGKMQCVSCHDVHGRYANPGLLKMSNEGSRFCLTCHLK